MNRIDYPSIGETVFEETLPNGLRILVLPKPGYSERFAVFGTRYGGADRRFKYNGEWIDTPAGIAHFLEHKMFDMPDGTNIMAAFSARGARPNAFTGTDMTAYYVTCTEGFYDNLRTLLEYVSTPWYTPESVEKEQGIIAQEISMGNDRPGTVCYYNLLKSLYSNHPMRESIAGTVESIREITADVLYRCHKVFYNPSNMVLCCVGDIDPEKVSDIARDILPAEPGEVPERDYGTEDSLLPNTPLTEVGMAVSAPQFYLGSRITPCADDREMHRFSVLGGLALECMLGPASPLYNELYAEGLLTRNFGYQTDDTAGSTIIIMGGQSRDPLRVRDAVAARIDRIAREGLDAGQFERCRRALYGTSLGGLSSFSSIGISLMSRAFCGCRSLDSFELLSKVTADDAAGFLCENLSSERIAVSVVQPKG